MRRLSISVSAAVKWQHVSVLPGHNLKGLFGVRLQMLIDIMCFPGHPYECERLKLFVS